MGKKNTTPTIDIEDLLTIPEIHRNPKIPFTAPSIRSIIKRRRRETGKNPPWLVRHGNRLYVSKRMLEEEIQAHTAAEG